jgi:hypothetical protein
MSISISLLRLHQDDISNHRFEGLGWEVMKKLVTGWLVLIMPVFLADCGRKGR